MRLSSLLAGAVISLSLLVGAGTAAAQTKPVLKVEAVATPITEGAHAFFRITIDPAQSADFEVPILVSESLIEGAAQQGVVFAPGASATHPTSVTIPANAASVTLSVATDDNSTDQRDDRWARVIISSDPRYEANPNFAFVDVMDNDAPPMVSVTAAPDARAGTSLNFKVSLSAESEWTVTVDYITTGGTAVAGTDYTATSGTLTFDRGETEKTVSVPTLAAGANKNLQLRLSNASNVGQSPAVNPPISTSSAQGNIISAAPTLAIAYAAETRTEGTHESAVFIISSSQTLTEAVVVPVSVTETIESGRYIMGTPPTTVTIQANSSTVRLSVFIEDDDRYENTSAITAKITSNPDTSKFVLGATTAVVGIIPDDPLPIARVEALQQGAGEGVSLEFLVSLTPASDIAAAIQYTTSDGTATTADTDYTATSGTLSFAAGETRMTVTVATEEDTDITEGDETVHLVLSGPTNSSIGTVGGSASSIIRNKSILLSVARGGADIINEGDDAVFRISINPAQTVAVVVPVDVGESGRHLTDNRPTSVTIPANSSSVTVNVATEDDNRRDGGGAIGMTISNPDDSKYTLDGNFIRVFIQHDNDPQPVVNIAPAPAALEGDPLMFVVSLTAESDQVVEIFYYTEDGSATRGDDFTAIDRSSPGRVNLARRQTSVTIEIATVADTISDDNEDMSLVLSLPTNAVRGTPISAKGVILEKHRISVTSDKTNAILEDAGPAVFTISRSRIDSTDLVVPVTITESGFVIDNTVPLPTLVTIQADQASAKLNIALDDDDVYELLSYITVTISSNPDSMTFNLAPTTASVGVDDNEPGRPGISVAAAADVREGDPLLFVVSLSRRTELSLTVEYQTSDGTAKSGTDYTATSGTLTFPRRATSRTIEVPTLTTSTTGTGGTVNLILSNPTVGPVVQGMGSAAGTIRPTPVIDILTYRTTAPTALPESTTMNIELAATPAPVKELTVKLELTPGMGNYLTESATAMTVHDVVFAAGASTATFSFHEHIDDDDVDEPDGSVELSIQGTTRAAGDPAMADYFVTPGATNRTASVTIGIMGGETVAREVRTSHAFGQEGGDVEFVVLLAGLTEFTVTVEYETSEGTAEDPADYTGVSGTLTFLPSDTGPGSNRRTITVTTINDSVAETGIENFHLILTMGMNSGETFIAPPTGSLLVATATFMGGISDLPVLSLVADVGSNQYDESDTAVFTISLTEAATQLLTVPVMVTDRSGGGGGVVGLRAPGVALAGDTHSLTTEVTIPTGQRSVKYSLSFDDDDRRDSVGSYSVAIGNPDANAYFIGAGTSTIDITVVDLVDTSPTVNVSSPDAFEGEGLLFEVRLTRQADVVIWFDYMTSDGEAKTGDSDYTAASGSLSFAARELVKTITVATLTDNTVTELPETVYLLLTGLNETGTRATTGRSEFANGQLNHMVTGTILGDMPALSITAGKTSYMENEAASLTISIQPAQTTPVVVPLTVTAGVSTVIGGTPPASVTIPANSSATVLTLAFDDDERQDDPTKVTVTIGNPDTSAYAVRFAEVVLDVEDDGDAAPMISFGTVQPAAETTPLRFPVTLTAESDRTVIVHYATSDGTATAGDDYTATSGILTFPPRVTVRTVSVPTFMAADDGETVFLRLANADGATIATSAAADGAAGAIVELPVISIAADTATVVESADAVFTITVNLGPTQDVALPLTLTQTGDFLGGSPGSVTIPAGEVSVKLTIALDDDTTDEDNGSITVTLSNPDPLLYALGAASASVTVEDDDSAPTVSVKAVADAREGDSLLFLVSLSAVSGKVASVGYATEDGTATEGEDYEAASGQLTFQAGVTEQTVAVTTIRDTVSDPDETLHLVLAAPTNVSLDTQAGTHRATGTIVEGLGAEEAQQVNEAILPYVASALGGITSRALQDRTKVALGGLQPKGLSVRGSSLGQFLVAQAKPGSDPALFNRGLSQAPGMHPGAFDANQPYTSLDQWQAQADARGAAGSQRRPRLGIGDLDFTMALSGGQGQQSASGSLHLWGSGYYTDLANDEGEVPFEGKVTGGMLGIDMMYAGWLMGVAVNRTETDVDWSYQDFSGSHEISLTGFHPYFARQLDEYTRVWFTLGHEQGEAEITETGRSDLCAACKFDVTMTSAALGVSSRLHETATESGTARINFIADGSYSQIKADTQQAVTAAASWLRLGLELEHQRALSGDNHLGSSVELVMRSDFEDARRGKGVELGGNLDLNLPAIGLRLDLAARTLLAHSAAVDEWGISGGVRWAVRQGGKGFSLAFKPQWGALGSARDALWEHGLSADYNQSQADAPGPGRYTLELTYGLPILHGQDLLTLFTRSNHKADGRDLTLGADLNLGQHLTSGYELLLHQNTTTTAKPPEHRAFIRYQRAF